MLGSSGFSHQRLLCWVRASRSRSLFFCFNSSSLRAMSFISRSSRSSEAFACVDAGGGVGLVVLKSGQSTPKAPTAIPPPIRKMFFKVAFIGVSSSKAIGCVSTRLIFAAPTRFRLKQVHLQRLLFQRARLSVYPLSPTRGDKKKP